MCHGHSVAFEVQFNSGVFKDGLEMQLLTTTSILLQMRQPSFKQGGNRRARNSNAGFLN